MKKLLNKYSLIFICLFATTIMFSQANVVITTTNPANDATVSVTAGGTFTVPFSYTSDEAIVLTVQLELVSFGGSGAASYAVPGTETTLNLAATAMASAQTATLTFPTDNPITGTDFGAMSTWTLLPGGDNNAESGLTVTGSGPNSGYRVKFITDDAADTITGSAGDFPFTQSMTPPTNIEFRDLDFDDIDGVTVPPPPAEIIELVSVLNSASSGVATTPIATVERGATFPVQFTLNTDSEITKLTVSLNLVGFNGAPFREYDIPGTEVEFNNITSTGGMDQDFTANIPFPTDATIMEGGVTWTLDRSQDPTLQLMNQIDPNGLRNDSGTNNTNYRFKFVLDGQTFSTNTVTNGSGYVDTVILEITEQVLNVQDLQAIGINAFYNPTTQSIELSSDKTIGAVNVYSIAGQTVSSTDVNSANANIDLSNLSSGIYIARIINDSGFATLKMAKN